MKFAKPPLIELIAEFRWLPLNPQGEEITNPATILQAGPQGEAFYDSFRRAVAANGYPLSERLIPLGFPHPMHQPIFRFSRDSQGPGPTGSIYQIGAGILSVHALPPYENWEAFRPIISSGLDALIATRLPPSRINAFTSVSLRYIDAFSQELRGERSEREFLSEVLQLDVHLPASLLEEAATPNLVQVAMQLKSRTKSGLDLTLSVGPNVDQGDPQRIVMDTMVSSPTPTECNRESALEVLERAHTCIRSLFVGMTGPIHNLMVLLPEGGH